MHDRTSPLRERTADAAGASPTAQPATARVQTARLAATLNESLRIPLAVALAAGLLMSFTAPFGTDAAPPLRRTFYWVGVMMLGTFMGVSMRPLVRRTGWFARRRIAEAAAVTLLIVLIGTTAVWLITSLTFGLRLTARRLEFYFGPMAVLSSAMTALNYALNRDPPETRPHSAPDAAPARFVDRLPLHLKSAEILAVSAEDHYLRAHTSGGDALILMRLSDAVAELDGLEGAQTHRSWWVAKAAVAAAERSQGRARLTLRNGVTAPVSRSYAQALRQDGWF